MSGKAWARANLFGSGNGDQGSRPSSTDLREWLDGLREASLQQVGDFEFLPLVRPDGGGSRLVTAEEAMVAGDLEIVEMGAGIVGEVEARNTGSEPVLILEGDTLVGAKQNRVVAHSVVVPTGGRIAVPVGCMEQGRWGRGAGVFAAGASRMESPLRRSTVREKSRARRAGSRPCLDQQRLWRDVSFCLGQADVRSLTGNYHKLIERRERDLREVVEHVVPVKDQVGMVFLYRERLVGIEIVGHPAMWSSVARKTIGSFVAGGRSHLASRGHAVDRRSAREWLAALRDVRLVTRPGLGAGTDLELRCPGLVGSGLWHEDGLAHLAVFPEA